MNQLIVSSYDEFASYLGKKLGESDWLLVDQDRINLFADATLDHQWIHVDTDRAAKESPYGCTIAHGYLTLSLLPYMWAQVLEVRNISMLVNYGMDKMRFGKPVKVGSRVRLVVSLDSIENLRGICNRPWRALPPSSTTSSSARPWPVSKSPVAHAAGTTSCATRSSLWSLPPRRHPVRAIGTWPGVERDRRFATTR